ncbi:MAG TPA: TMEM175 family protein [Vicinamibacterales bacterium]|nr:TMEM175 family protein [Vicinamibacterales bacterium]
MIPRYGREVSRIEGFSDAVFGFALTLLVVSLEVPDSFDGLKQILRGFIPFAATFALVCWIWFEHYAFFRKFEAEDPLTIFLNCVLLFLVLFFVYPLKFVFTRVIPAVMGQPDGVRLTEGDARMMMWIYSAGFVAMMAVFAMLYWNQYRSRKALGLSDEQAFVARAGARTHVLSVLVGSTSVVMALTVPIQWIWTAGVIYAFQGPLHWQNGVLIERARAKAFPSSTPARP